VADAVAGAEVIFICVGTPPRASGEASLAAVERAAHEAAYHVRTPAVLVEKSTVPAGTAERIKQMLRRSRAPGAKQLEVVSNPEFLREGKAIEDTLRPSRIVVGGDSPRAFETMRRLHQPLIDGGSRYIETDIQTAELAKHACNAFLALKISYANALARMCEKAGADVVAVADVMGSDPRIGRAFLNAGLGYGGYCFPKDLVAFERLSEQLGYGFPLLREVARINESAVTSTVTKIREALWNLEDKRIALLGLSFKPNTDDLREAPSLRIAQALHSLGARAVGYDPVAGKVARMQSPDVMKVVFDPYEALEGAHAAVVVTEWDEFRTLDLERAASLMRKPPLLIDGRNALDAREVEAAGIRYRGFGRV
jgi:UDPglucose 6-dehydrogenase